MNEQLILLKAIHDQPQDDILRLAYADWLDEHKADEPNAAATSEFIRVSCGLRRASSQMPKAAYRWLEVNWKRLVPRVLAHHVPYEAGETVLIHGHQAQVATGDGPLWSRSGKKVWTKIRLKGKAEGYSRSSDRAFGCTLELVFWKGLVESVAMFSGWGWAIIKKSMLLDQPGLMLLDQPGLILSQPI